MDGSRVILAAHRGDRFNFPENTMPAFESAVKFGVDMIETDVRMTGDGELVLIHDRSALRTAGVDKNIDEMTLSEVMELDAGCTFTKPVKTGVPTVRELLDMIKNTDVLVNWELKVYPNDFDNAYEVADKLIALIEEYNMTEKSMMNSFSSKSLEYICKKYKNKFMIHGQGINNCRRSNDIPELSETEIFDWCCLYSDRAGMVALDFKENFDYCIENNIIPCLCIADDMDDYRKAVDYGCRMFTSNNIFEAERILKELKVR